MKPTSKETKLAALDLEFERSKTLTVAQYNVRHEAIRLEADDLPTPPPGQQFVTMEALTKMAQNLAAAISPLKLQLATLEKEIRNFRAMEESGSALSVSQLAHSIALLNEKLSQPVAPIYDDAGRLIGAARVPRLDS